MKSRCLFSKRKAENIVYLISVEFAHRVIKVKYEELSEM